ncbi:MAG: hypothetical protein LBR53_09425 [Deltaproteobacteria bacterium]|jgi:transposase|nr:hypothetical protein [Deltaproteobacteria bacterium]
MLKKAKIFLNPEEQAMLSAYLSDGSLSPSRYRRALVVSLINQGLTDLECSRQSAMSPSGVKKIRNRFQTLGLANTIIGEPKGHRPRALSAESEAKLYSLTKETKHNGRKAWTLKALRSYVLEVEGIFLTLESIRRIIKREGERQSPETVWLDESEMEGMTGTR